MQVADPDVSASGEERFWCQTRLGVRAEPLGSLGIIGPLSLCIFVLPPPVGVWPQIRVAGGLLLSHQLEPEAEEKSPQPLLSWLDRNSPAHSAENCSTRRSGEAWCEQFVSALWTSCTPASTGSLRSSLDYRARVSQPLSSFPPCLGLHPCRAGRNQERERGGEGTLGTLGPHSVNCVLDL